MTDEEFDCIVQLLKMGECSALKNRNLTSRIFLGLFPSDEQLIDFWERLRKDIFGWHVSQHPNTQPWVWWHFDASEQRRIVGDPQIVGFEPEDDVRFSPRHYKWKLYFGMPRRYPATCVISAGAELLGPLKRAVGVAPERPALNHELAFWPPHSPLHNIIAYVVRSGPRAHRNGPGQSDSFSQRVVPQGYRVPLGLFAPQFYTSDLSPFPLGAKVETGLSDPSNKETSGAPSGPGLVVDALETLGRASAA